MESSSGLFFEGLRLFVSMNEITSLYFFIHSSSWIISIIFYSFYAPFFLGQSVRKGRGTLLLM